MPSISPSKDADFEMTQVIGQNLKRLRVSRGVSQEALGSALSVTFQQVQKYENGMNRISPAKLLHASRVLKCELLDFFSGSDAPGGASAPGFGTTALRVASIVEGLSPRHQSVIMTIARTLAKDHTSEVEPAAAPNEQTNRV